MRNFQTGHYVGAYLKGHDGRLYLCVAYDPSIDYFVCTVDDGPPRFTDISTRAIGRTYHLDAQRDDFSRPTLLVAAVRAAYRAAVTGTEVPIEDEGCLSVAGIYAAAKAQFTKWAAA